METTEEVWSATITADMISHLSDEEVTELMIDLSDAVMQICIDYNIE